MFSLVANQEIKWKGGYYKRGSKLVVDDEYEARELCSMGCRVVEITRHQKPGKKIILYHGYATTIGGIETLLQNVAQTFPEYNITYLYGNADAFQLIELSKYWNVKQYNNEAYDCDILISMLFDTPDCVYEKIHAKKVYCFYAHACWKSYWPAVKNLPYWRNFILKKSDFVDTSLSVSKTACDELKEQWGMESEIVDNFVVKQKKPLIFLTLSRLTEEKGGKQLVKMVEEFDKAGKEFMWMVAAPEEYDHNNILNRLASFPQVVFVKPSLGSRKLVFVADYIVQPSQTEAFCYGAYEALAEGKPVIMLRHAQSEAIIKDGKNGYLFKQDLSDLDVEKIFKHIPKDITISLPTTDRWRDLLEGKI